jgi:hypothetical protein
MRERLRSGLDQFRMPEKSEHFLMSCRRRRFMPMIGKHGSTDATVGSGTLGSV